MDNLLAMKPGESLWMPVLSGSMAPQYLPGDEVRVTAIGRDDISRVIMPGSVAVFYESGRFFFHRVLVARFSGSRVYQKGDANREGAWIGTERIVGTVEEGRRRDGNGFAYFHGHRHRFCFLSYCRARLHGIVRIVIRGI